MRNHSSYITLIAAISCTSAACFGGLPIFAGSTFDPSTNAGVQAMSGQLGGPWINEKGIAVGNGGAEPGLGADWAVVRWGPSMPSERLGSLGTNSSGGEFPKATAINDDGIVVGGASRYDESHTSLGTRPVRWDRGATTATELLISDNPSTFQTGAASGIDLHGNIGGSGGATAGFPFRWSGGSVQGQHLATLGSPESGHGTGSVHFVTRSGVMVGRATRYENGSATGSVWARWDTAGNPVQLNTPPAVGNLIMRDASDLGAVILTNGGDALYAPADGVDFIKLKDISVGTFDSSIAMKISSSNIIVGTSTQNVGTSTSYIAPVVWPTPTSEPVELQVPRPSGSSPRVTMTGVNASGHSVGTVVYVNTGPSGNRPYLWNLDGTGTELQTLIDAPGWMLQSVNDLSDTGWVVGEALFDPDGEGPIASYRRFYSLLLPHAGTYGKGDADFSGAINFDDLLLLAQHYGTASNSRVDVADLDLDGVTDFDDLLTLAQNYASPASFEADWALAQSMVPEPASILAAVCLVPRRRRRA